MELYASTRAIASFLALVAALAAAPAADAAIFTVTGDTTAKPIFTRPLEDLSALSAVGIGVHYDTLSFSANVAGNYTFLTTGNFDTFSILYSGIFTPATSLSNAMIANDDLVAGFTTSGYAAALLAGVTYVLVTTGFAPTDFGNYSITIGGPGVIGVASPVPEAESYALMVLGLGLIGLLRRRQDAAHALSASQ